MKIMTLQKVVKTIKKMDAETAVNESMLTDLIDHGCIPSYKHGNRKQLMTRYLLIFQRKKYT